jgi:ADP-ribosylglycohydrolase
VTLPDLAVLRTRLRHEVVEEGLDDLIAAVEGAEGYDGLEAIAAEVARRSPPEELDAIWQRCPAPVFAPVAVPDAGSRAEAAFLGSVAGCMLGKPLEIAPTLEEIRTSLTPHGEWPLTDYLTEAAIHSLRELQGQWRELARERIDHVAADDDINYTVLGMLALERRGADFTRRDLLLLWLYNLPVLTTFGPERTFLVQSAAAALTYDRRADFPERLDRWNPGSELCGALIRADAYGYACQGDPRLAAELAWRDAGMTHRRTGLYGAMFVAAAIAAMPVSATPLDAFRTALGFVPEDSKLAEAVRFALEEVSAASTWLAAYERINARYGDYGHCLVLQEVGTLVNTLHFARDVGDGICIQVMQGNDTDSFGATAGSLLGTWFGPGHLESRWLEPFDDRIQLALATTWISSLSELTARMGALPERIRSAPDPATPGTA